jgi:hypothetical protein
VVTMFIRHQVNDYAKWRQAYDAFADGQKRLGVRAEAVYQAPHHPNDLTVTHDFDTLEAARSFLGSDELRSVMAQAGVANEPTIWFAEERA